MKIGLLGGAFDPVTLAHVAVVRYLVDTKVVDEAYLLPCFRHIFGKRMTTAEHRLTMCKLAVNGIPRISVCPVEIDSQLSGSTLQLIKQIINMPVFADDMIHMIVGMDNANSIDKWTKYEELLQTVAFIVVGRAGVSPTKDWYLKLPHQFVQANLGDTAEISSTKFRALNLDSAVGQQRAKEIVNPNVLDYINYKELYRGRDAD